MWFLQWYLRTKENPQPSLAGGRVRDTHASSQALCPSSPQHSTCAVDAALFQGVCVQQELPRWLVVIWARGRRSWGWGYERLGQQHRPCNNKRPNEQQGRGSQNWFPTPIRSLFSQCAKLDDLYRRKENEFLSYRLHSSHWNYFSFLLFYCQCNSHAGKQFKNIETIESIPTEE